MCSFGVSFGRIGFFLFFTQSQTIAFRIDSSSHNMCAIRIHFIHRLYCFFFSNQPNRQLNNVCKWRWLYLEHASNKANCVEDFVCLMRLLRKREKKITICGTFYSTCVRMRLCGLRLCGHWSMGIPYACVDTTYTHSHSLSAMPASCKQHIVDFKFTFIVTQYLFYFIFNSFFFFSLLNVCVFRLVSKWEYTDYI